MSGYTFELPDWLKGYPVTSAVMPVVCGLILDVALLFLLLSGELGKVRLIRGEWDFCY